VFAVRLECVLAFAQAVPVRSALAVQVRAKSDPAPLDLVMIARARHGPKLNHDGSARRVVPVVNPKVPSRQPHDLQRVQ
jgi:hypothetical protein